MRHDIASKRAFSWLILYLILLLVYGSGEVRQIIKLAGQQNYQGATPIAKENSRERVNVDYAMYYLI